MKDAQNDEWPDDMAEALQQAVFGYKRCVKCKAIIRKPELPYGQDELCDQCADY